MKSVYCAVRPGSFNNTDVFFLQRLNLNFIDLENISNYCIGVFIAGKCWFPKLSSPADLLYFTRD